MVNKQIKSNSHDLEKFSMSVEGNSGLFYFFLLYSVIGPEILRLHNQVQKVLKRLHQSGAKVKPITTWLLALFRTLGVWLVLF